MSKPFRYPINDISYIHHDPFTRTHLEGLARILAYIKSFPDGSTLYRVHFLDDQPDVTVPRVIAPPK